LSLSITRHHDSSRCLGCTVPICCHPSSARRQTLRRAHQPSLRCPQCGAPMELQGAQQEAQRCPCSEHHRAAQPRHMPGGLGTTHHLRASRGGCHRSCKPPEASPRLVVCAKESLPSASLRVAAPKRSRPTIRSFPAPELQPITMRVDSHLTSHSGRTVHKESNRGRGKRSALPTRSRGRRGVAGTLLSFLFCTASQPCKHSRVQEVQEGSPFSGLCLGKKSHPSWLQISTARTV